jgi:hypothetical protein
MADDSKIYLIKNRTNNLLGSFFEDTRALEVVFDVN